MALYKRYTTQQTHLQYHFQPVELKKMEGGPEDEEDEEHSEEVIIDGTPTEVNSSYLRCLRAMVIRFEMEYKFL